MADALVKEGRKIYLVLNTTEAPKQGIPPVIDNCSLREAQFRLKAAGFQVQKVDIIPGEREWVYGVRYDGIELENGAAISGRCIASSKPTKAGEEITSSLSAPFSKTGRVCKTIASGFA